MRRKDKLVTDQQILHDVINKAEVCRLGLCDGSTPYIVPMSFGFTGSHLYVHSAPEGRKIEILRKNNRVCVEFEQNVALITGKKACDYSMRYRSVLCDGSADPVEEHAEKCYALNQVMKHYEPDWQPYHFTDQELASVAVYKITIEQMTGKVSGVQEIEH